MCGTVGVFDSGVGGLSVLKECVQVLPCADYIYYADTSSAPYGNKSEEEIISLSFAAVDRLLLMGAEIVVVACNTATSAAIEKLRAAGRKVIGIEPSVKPAASFLGEGERALVLATAATIRQKKLNRLIDRLGRERFVLSAQSGLAAVIDDNIMDINSTRPYITSLLEPYSSDLSIKAIVLGCTHYVFAAEIIARVMSGAKIFDGNYGVAKQLAATLIGKSPDCQAMATSDKTINVRFLDSGKCLHDYNRVWQAISQKIPAITITKD